MYITNDLGTQIMREIDNANRLSVVKPINLNPPGGIYGQISQSNVTFDNVELVDETISASGVSLLTNLNRIRAGVSLGDGIIHLRHLGDDIVFSGSGGGHVIEDEGAPLTQRSKLNFVGTGVTVTDDSGNDASVVTISVSGVSGVTSVATGTGLTGGPITTTGTITLANTAVTPGVYGDTTHIPQVTIDQQGRITLASGVPITTSGGGVTDHGALTGLSDDDHPQYQLRSEKGTLSGYASLDGTTKVPFAQLPTGTASNQVSIGNHSHTIPSGTVTSITAGTGIALTPNPIVANGTIALNAVLNDLTDVDTTGEANGDVIYLVSGLWQPYPLGLGDRITSSNNKVRIGDVSAGNYLEIDGVTGNLRLLGNATAWDDFRVEASIVKAGATAPQYKAFGPSGNLQALMFEAGHHDEAMFEMQMPHNWKEGTNIYPHVHWTPTTADAGNVVWELEYSWSNINSAFGAPSNMASDATAAGGTAWVHKLTYLKSGGNNYIDATGKTLSSMLLCRLHRNSNSGSDTLNKDVAFLEVDFHYQIDSFGSDSELTKDTSASVLLESGDILLLESDDRLLME